MGNVLDVSLVDRTSVLVPRTFHLRKTVFTGMQWNLQIMDTLGRERESYPL